MQLWWRSWPRAVIDVTLAALGAFVAVPLLLVALPVTLLLAPLAVPGLRLAAAAREAARAVARGRAGRLRSLLRLLGISLVCATLLLVGILAQWLLAAVLAGTRTLAGQARERAAAVLGRPVACASYASPPGIGTSALVTRLRDPQVLLDLAWLAAHTVAIGLAVGVTVAVNVAVKGLDGVIAGCLLVAFLLWGVPTTRRLLAGLAGALLASDVAGMRARVSQLATSRAEAVDAQAAELRRIERDLHDGAQARLAAVGMSLGLAQQALRSDPGAAEQLLEEGRDHARQALAELRSLVRGIHPPVLADRGLAGGLEAAALMCPVPVSLDVELPVRPDPPVESAVYFAAAEALANVGRHSRAGRAWITARCRDGRMQVVVGDDGIGGADAGAGSGLRGIARRLAVFDGSVVVSSPPGGPTEIVLEVPCASS